MTKDIIFQFLDDQYCFLGKCWWYVVCRKKVNAPPALTQKTIDFSSTHFNTSLQQDNEKIHQDDRQDNEKNGGLF